MRTTITLDEDVAELLEETRRRRRTTFKRAVNDALREGLMRLNETPPATPFKTRPVSVGKLLVDNVDCIGELLERLEGADWK